MTQIIAIVNQKGGTGKTTTAVNLGRAIADMGKRVLLLDLDPQGSLSYYLGANSNVWTISDVILGDISLNNAIIQRENLEIIPADISLADLEVSLAGYPQREFIIKKLLLQAPQYDYILMDCSPSLSVMTINALTAAKYIIIPLQMEVLSIHGLELMLETVERIKKNLNPTLEIMGILPLMYDRKRRITQEVLAHIVKTYSFLYMFDTLIRMDVKLVEAPSYGKSVFSYAPDANGAQDYMKLAKEVVTYDD